MKQIVLLLALFLVGFSGLKAQEPEKKSRKEIRAERQAQKKEAIKNMLKDTAFVFKPTHVMPMSGGSKHLNYVYEAEVRNDTLASYLPFYGVAYRVDYMAMNSGLDFVQPIEEYKMEKDKDGYIVLLDVKNKMDFLTYTFHISDLGYCTLSVVSTNRQAISFYGRIEAPEEEK